MATDERYAGRLAENGPLTVRAIKRPAFEREFELSTPIFRSEDAVEGPLAFL